MRIEFFLAYLGGKNVIIQRFLLLGMVLFVILMI